MRHRATETTGARRPPRLAVGVVAALLLAACGGPVASPTGSGPGPGSSSGSASPAVPSGVPPAALPSLAPPPTDVSKAPARVHADASRATATWIGPAGGSLTATAADGTTFDLVIPPLAVSDPTPIVMAPVDPVDDLGLSGGVAGAVYLEPAGLILAEPATLDIEVGKEIPDGTRVVGFDVADDGSTGLVPATGDEGEYSVLVFHFSAPGVAFGTSADLARLDLPPAGGRLSTALTRFLAYDVPWSATTMAEAFAGLTIAWDQAMQPELERVSDDRALLAALADWRQFVFLINLFANRGDVDAALAAGSLTISGPFPSLSDPSGYYHAGLSLVARRISDALDGNKRLCNASHDLNALANVWFWAQAGLRYDEQFTQWEDRARGCADLDLPVVNLPTSMTQGGVGSVDLQFAMTFADRTRVPVDVETTLHGARFTFARTGSVDATAVVTAGTTLSEGVFAAGPGPYGLTIQACWTLGGLPRTVCARFQRAFGLGPSPTPAPSLSTSQTGLPDWLRGSYDVNLICENNVYGTGSARVTVSGMTVSLTWSVTLTAPPTTTANCLKALQEGAFPSRGSFTGTGSLVGSSKVDVAISSWEVEPCPGSHAGSTMATFLGARIGIPIGMCVPQGLFGVMGYQAVWVAP